MINIDSTARLIADEIRRNSRSLDDRALIAHRAEAITARYCDNPAIDDDTRAAIAHQTMMIIYPDLARYCSE